jgi:CRP-like cAMP-binding protein
METSLHWHQNPKEFETLSKRFVEEVLPRFTGTVRQRFVPAGETLELNGSCLWVVKDGLLDVVVNGRPLETLKEGGVLGPWFGAAPCISFAGVQHGCHVVGYDNNELSTLFRQASSALHHWSSMVAASAARYFALFSELKVRAVPPPPKFRSFSPGEVILKEGEFSQEVLCLVDGDADVIAHGAKVGKVKHEELFGALAAITGAPRMASVVASKPTTCMVFERDDFEDLLRSHTALMSKLFEDMARAMHEANAKIAKLEAQQKGGEKRWGLI